ncbi:Uncharacterized CDP-alcohol phosphatidyltransferase class-I family protein C22A12.08c [Serendipita indica DSM 11827]|nr:Uncharacterized CDP-alcohol phosphatidyltransferase class-I family protein C22A12.08c [Serendipita indica DSM 11827]
MTNGGGKPEEERCRELSERLQSKIDLSMFVQSHTVLSSPVLPYLSRYRDRAVMVLGGVGDTCRKIAEGYGYQNVVIPADVLAWNPDLWPFYKLRDEEKAYVRRDFDFSTTPIEAVFVFHDPRNWALDVQITLDILRYGSKGRPAFTRSNDTPHSHVHADPLDAVELVFCNPDLIWRGAYFRPRLGQGAFREAFQGVYKALEPKQYPYKQLGKPTRETYHHAESLLLERAQEIRRFSAAEMHNISKRNIYMIGDNPESDIAGANAAGWQSVLVHTGVYSPSDGVPTHKPTFQARDVEEAVHNVLSTA